MDMDNHPLYRARMALARLWRPLPWWERVVYLLTILVLVLALLASVLSDRAPTGWPGDWSFRWLTEISTLLLIVWFPFGVATCCLGLRRWSPETWHEFRRLWSMRAIVVGCSVLFALGGWDTVLALTSPADQIPPYLPSFLAPPAIAAACFLFVGVILAGPELVVRMSRANRWHP